MATAAISPVISLVTGLIGGLLGQHSLRLKDATSENESADSGVPAFDQDLQEIVNAYNSGQINASEATQALASVDSKLYQYFHSLVGKPGTAWTGQQKSLTDQTGVTCGKSCTVSCCIYNDDIHPAIVLAASAINGQPMNDVRVKPVSGGWNIMVPEVFPSSYSQYTRPKYAVFVADSPSMSAAITSGNPLSILTSVSDAITNSAQGIESTLGFTNPQAPTQKGSMGKWFLVAALALIVFLYARSR